MQPYRFWEKPARCPHCGYTPGVIQSDFVARAQANCEHRESHAQPAPAPPPGEVAFLQIVVDGKASGRMCEWPQLVPACRAALAHISDLTRRLAEAEAENGRFAGMLEDSVSGWRKLYTEERAERVRIEGVLLNDVQAERQESDEHIKGLNAVIKTQDKAIRDLKSRVELAADWQVQFAKAEAAEARVRELEAIVYRTGPEVSDETHCGIDEERCPTPGLKCHYCQKNIDKDNRAADLEAFKARVMEWARGRCGTCGPETESDDCRACRNGYDLEEYPQAAQYADNWTPPQAWEAGE